MLVVLNNDGCYTAALSPMFPLIKPMELALRVEPFEHADWIFELKHDGFRALAYVEHDLESIVAKQKRGIYSSPAKWIKVKNRSYSQVEGRHELFERRFTGSTVGNHKNRRPVA